MVIGPWGPLTYISGAQLCLGLFGFWQDWRTHISLFSQKRITDLYRFLIQDLGQMRHSCVWDTELEFIQELSDSTLVVPGYH